MAAAAPFTDLAALVQLLERAVADPTGLDGNGAAGAALASVEERVGGCSALMAVASDPSVPASHAARWLAAVQLKNAVGRQWRPRGGGGAHTGVPAEEKAALRPRLVAALASSPVVDPRLAAQLALALGKVARWDWPREWPDLVPQLLGAAAQAKAAAAAAASSGGGGGDPAPAAASALRLYLALHHVVKELSSKRLAMDRRAFGELTTRGGLLDGVWAAWVADLQEAMAAVGGGGAGNGNSNCCSSPPPLAQLLLERWLLQNKVVRRLLVWGVDGDAHSREPSPVAVACLPGLLDAARALAAAADASSPLQPLLRRCALKALKTLAAAQQAHPWAALAGARTAVPTLEWAFARLMAAADVAAAAAAQQQQAGLGGDDDDDDDEDDSGRDSEQDALLIRCALLLLDALQCDAYRTGGGGGVGRGRGSRGAAADASGAAASEADPAAAAAAEAQRLLSAFWDAPWPQPPTGAADQQHQQPRCAALVRALVARLGLPLTARDLRAWRRDPEAFFHSPRAGGGGLALEGGGDGTGGFGGGAGGSSSATDSLRSAAEALLVVLVRRRREQLAPVLAAEVGAAVQRAQAAAAQAAAAQAATSAPPVVVVAAGVPRHVVDKDAAYAAAALTCYELHDHVDYAPWLRGSLLPELLAVAAGAGAPPPLSARVGRRAACRVLGSWAARLPEADRPSAYSALASCLEQEGAAEGDACVALTAAAALRTLCDDFSFDADGFAASAAAPRAMDGLAKLLARSRDLDTQTQAFGLFGLLIDRLGPAIRPLVPGLLQLLPRVWEAAGGATLGGGAGGGGAPSNSAAVDSGRSLLRIQVLAALSGLVNALAEDSATLLPAAVAPAVAQVLPQEGYGDELAEDALALWIVAARNAPSLPWSVDGGGGGGGPGDDNQQQAAAAASAAFAAASGADEQARQQAYQQLPQLSLLTLPTLLPKLAALARHSTEHLPAATVLLQSLLLLGGPSFSAAASQELAACFAGLASDVSERGALLLLPPLDLMLRLSPDAAAVALAPALATLLVEVALPKVGVVGGGGASTSAAAGPEAQEEAALAARRNPRVASGVFVLLSRLLLLRPAAFEAVLATPAVSAACVAAAAAATGVGGAGGGAGAEQQNQVLFGLASCWVAAADAAAGRLARKLHAAGLAALLGAAPGGALSPLLDAVCAQVCGAWAELEQGRRFGAGAGGRGGGGEGGGVSLPTPPQPPFYDDDDMLYFESPYLGGRAWGGGGDDDGGGDGDAEDAAAMLREGVLGTDAVALSEDAAGDGSRRAAAAGDPRWEPLRSVRLGAALGSALQAAGAKVAGGEAALAAAMAPEIRVVVERAVASAAEASAARG